MILVIMMRPQVFVAGGIGISWQGSPPSGRATPLGLLGLADGWELSKRIYTHVYAKKHIYMYIYIHSSVNEHKYAYVHIYIYTYACITSSGECLGMQA